MFATAFGTDGTAGDTSFHPQHFEASDDDTFDMNKSHILPKASVFILPGEDAIVVNVQGDEAYQKMHKYLQATQSEFQYDTWEDLKDLVENDGFIECHELSVQVIL